MFLETRQKISVLPSLVLYFILTRMAEAKIEYLDLYRPRKPILAKVLISQYEFLDVLETVEKYIGHLRPLRKNQKHLDDALEIVKEMKLVGMLNFHFRQETYDQLQDLLDDMYAEVHS
jgi:hypothetical protein